MRIAATLVALALSGGVARADGVTPAFELGWNIGEGRAFAAAHPETGADLGAGLRWRRLSLLGTAQINTYVATATPGVEAYAFGGRARYELLLSAGPSGHRTNLTEERTLYVDAGVGTQFLHPRDGGADVDRGVVSLGTGLALSFVDRRPRTMRIGWYLGVRATFARGLPAAEPADTAALRIGPPEPVAGDERSYVVTVGWQLL